MIYYNSDFVTNSSSSNYIAVLKKIKDNENISDYLRKALGISKDSSLNSIVRHIESNSKPVFGQSSEYTLENYQKKFVEDYGEDIANEAIKLISEGKEVFYVNVTDNGGDETIQELIMYEESNISNKYILLARNKGGY